VAKITTPGCVPLVIQKKWFKVLWLQLALDESTGQASAYNILKAMRTRQQFIVGYALKYVLPLKNLCELAEQQGSKLVTWEYKNK